MEDGLLKAENGVRSDGGAHAAADASRDEAGALPPIPRAHKVIFGLPQFTAAAAGLTSQVFLNKLYSDTFLVSLDFLAAMSFVAGLAGLYFQVYIGYVSDRTVHPMGRRRPYILGLGPLKEVCFLLLMFPLLTSQVGASLWFGVFFFAFNVLAEGLDISLNAWGAEMTNSNTDRSSLWTWFNGLGFIGLICAALGDVVLSAVLPSRVAFGVLGGMIACVGWTGYYLIITRLKERPENLRQPIPLVPSLRRCARNQCWLTFVKSSAVFSAINEITSLFTYLFKYVYELDADTYVGILVIMYSIACVVSMPVSLRYIAKIGKIRTFRICMIGVVVYGGLAFVATYTSQWLLAFAGVILGFSLGAVNVLSDIFLSDCIDYDELLSGKRREGSYMSVSRIPNQFFSVGGRAVPFVIMAALGYTPNVPQNENVKFCLRVFVSLFPAALSLIAYFMFVGYPIDEAMHNRIQLAVADMHAKSKEQHAAQRRIRQSVSGNGNEAAVSVASVSSGGLLGNPLSDENEAVPLTVEDPVTKLMMPIPKPDYFSELGAQQSGASAALTAPSPAPSVNHPPHQSVDALDEWLLDYFSARELHLANSSTHGVSRLHTEIVISMLIWMVGTIALGLEGCLLFLASSHYVSLIWVLGSASCSVLAVLEIMRVPAVNRLATIPVKVLSTISSHHLEQLARFQSGVEVSTGIGASGDNTTPAERVTRELTRLKTNHWDYVSWVFNRTVPFWMAAGGYFILRASWVADT